MVIKQTKMQIPFIKMHGLGNDYVYIDCFPAETAELLAKIDWHAVCPTAIQASEQTDWC